VSVDTPSASIAGRAIFIAWGPPSHANRTRVFAENLGIDVLHVFSTRRRGALAAPIKYPYQAIATVVYLIRRRPDVVLVQNPPSFAAVLIAVYSVFTGARFVVDAHTDAFVRAAWTRPRRLYRWVARRAVATIVTNEHLADRVRAWGADACVIRDIPTRFDPSPYELGPEFNVAVVSTFAGDEPIDEVIAAARSLPDVRFHVTGDTNRENASIPTSLPDNVELTGFLPLDQYYGLLSNSDAVMSLTTRNHTMQRGACEALWLGKPIVTSDWPLLRDYFRKGSVHVDNTEAGVREGIDRIRGDVDRYRREIVELQAEVAAEWQTARSSLIKRLNGLIDADDPGTTTPTEPAERLR
jgi:glycosyltransferase involved in cell wall biosynthesis